MNQSKAEFSWIRSQLYKECLQEFPTARDLDFETMQKYLNPQENEVILEVGAWSGFFSWKIADKCSMLYVSDPSSEQLEAVKILWKNNIEVLEWWAEFIELHEKSVDAIRSFWALHHCFNKTKAFENFHKVLKPEWRLVIVDVLSGSDLARHFDDKVAKYCITWHEVSFFTKEYFDSLCFVSNLKDNKTTDLDVKRSFNNEEDIWKFLYKLHAMTKTTTDECLKWAKDILWVEKKSTTYHLNRPLTVFTAIKR